MGSSSAGTSSQLAHEHAACTANLQSHKPAGTAATTAAETPCCMTAAAGAAAACPPVPPSACCLQIHAASHSFAATTSLGQPKLVHLHSHNLLQGALMQRANTCSPSRLGFKGGHHSTALLCLLLQTSRPSTGHQGWSRLGGPATQLPAALLAHLDVTGH